MKKILQKIIKLNSFRVLVLSLALSVISTVFAFEARADLVDDLIKKHKLDPKNNPKDQCELMNELGKKTSLANGGFCASDHAFCCDKYNNICEFSVITYEFDYDQQKFGYTTPAYYSSSYADYSTYIFSLIYHKQQKKVLGVSVKIENGDDYLYDSKELLRDKNFVQKSKLWIDIRNHPEFTKAKFQDKKIFFLPNQKVNFDDGQLRFVSPKITKKKRTVLKNFTKNSSYIKVRGCYIDEYSITNNPNFNHK